MSEEEKSYTSVLLPSARVALFTTDADTKQAFHGAESDWRFARVALESHEGDVEFATKHYQANAAPELVIIQTETIDDGFSDKLEALAGHLSENTSAIVIGPVNDVHLYKKLAAMGVSDYLVKPVTTETLAEDIATTLIEQIGVAESRMIALLGAKGGVGVTTIAEALAWHVSGDLDQKTFLLDAAGGWSTLSVGMQFEPSTTLAEAVRAASEGNEDSLTRMIHKANEKLFILSSGGDVMLDDNVDSTKYEVLLEYLMGLYPVVIVDLSGATAALKRTVLTRAHKTSLVTSPLLPSVRAARTLLQEIKELRGGEMGDVELILNMHGYSTKAEVPKAQIQDALEQDISITIPFKPDLFVSTESEATKLGEQKDGTDIMTDLLKSISKFLSVNMADNANDDKKSGIGNLLTKLKTKS